MAHYKLTGMHSHRHPFYGYEGPGDMFDENSPIGVKQALADSEVYEALAQQEQTKMYQFVRPMVEGVTSGLAVFTISKLLGVDWKKAAQVGFVYGGVSLAVGIAYDYMYREMEAIEESTQTLSDV